MYCSDAGVIVRLPEGTYGLLVPQQSETGYPVKDSFIISFDRSSFSGDCYGKIKPGEAKECDRYRVFRCHQIRHLIVEVFLNKDN